MSFDYTAVTAGIRKAPIEGFLEDVDGTAFETRIVAQAALADQVGPVYDVADDAEYNAIVSALMNQLKKLK